MPDAPIDLRSDTVTRPDEAMYRALRQAPLGDDVFEDDPTVQRLEERAAEMLGMERALFVPSGTMGNSIAIAVGSRPGDEVLVEHCAHSLHFEVAGGARLWGVQLRPLRGERGCVPLTDIRDAIRADNVHFPRTGMLILEQTNNLSGGCVLPLDYLERAGALCRDEGLSFHLDGARLFNAAIAAGVAPAAFAGCADSVTFCLSKGLGAPAGSVVAGSAAFVREARRVRKLLGGGMRQVGILAACGLHALEHNVDRLAEDHERARELATALEDAIAERSGWRVEPPETNMVYLRGPSLATAAALAETLAAAGIRSVPLGPDVRFVFHKDIDAATAAEARERIVAALAGSSG